MKLWAYCRECHWQADNPYDTSLESNQRDLDKMRGVRCPRCLASIIVVRFERPVWMRFGVALLTGQKRVADFISAASFRTAKREWDDEPNTEDQ